MTNIPDLPGHTLDPVPTRPATVVLTDYTAATIRELLAICEEFLRTSGPTVHDELRAYLACQSPPADPTWLIDDSLLTG